MSERRTKTLDENADDFEGLALSFPRSKVKVTCKGQRNVGFVVSGEKWNTRWK